MRLKHVLLGPVYRQLQHVLEHKGSLDPGAAQEMVFAYLYGHPSHALRDLAAAGYYLQARLAYRRRRAQAISMHYDLPPDFYRLFLDADYQAYSCAVFDRPALSLEAAQRRKFDILASKLEATPQHRIYEIGCGWGSFLQYAQEVGLHASGIALAQEQVAECRRRGFQAAYGDAAEHVPGPVDRLISIGMMEHAKNQRRHILSNCFQALSPGGRMVIQEMCDGPESGNLPAVVFVAEQHLPGDRLGSYVSIQRAARRAGFQIVHFECFGRHYRTTTLEWARRLAARFEAAEALVGYRTAMTFLLVQLGIAWYFEVLWISCSMCW
jgi:cyclopropane-fatty-acyl-phospholipid synthase